MFGPYVDTGVSRRPQTGQAHRLHRRRQPRPLPRRVLLRGKRRHPGPGHPRRLLQTRRPRATARRQRLHLLLPGNHPHLRPRRLHPAPHRRPRRRRQGQDRTLLPPRPRSVPGPKARPLLPRNPQPPVHPLGRKRLQRHAARRHRHEAHRPLRHRPGPRPLPAAVRTQRRTLLRRGHQEGQKRQHLQLPRPPLRNPRRSARQGDPAPLRPPPQ